MDDRPLRLFLAGVASGMALLALTWLTGSALSRDGDGLPGPTVVKGEPSSGPRIRSCADAGSMPSASRHRAAPITEEWQVYVNVLKDFDIASRTGPPAVSSGRTRPQEASVPSRARVPRPRAGCLSNAFPLFQDMRSCGRSGAPEPMALRVARTALDRWRHLRPLTPVRTGTVSPPRANQMRPARSHSSPHGTDAPRVTASAARGVPQCVAASTPSAWPASLASPTWSVWPFSAPLAQPAEWPREPGSTPLPTPPRVSPALPGSVPAPHEPLPPQSSTPPTPVSTSEPSPPSDPSSSPPSESSAPSDTPYP